MGWYWRALYRTPDGVIGLPIVFGIDLKTHEIDPEFHAGDRRVANPQEGVQDQCGSLKPVKERGGPTGVAPLVPL